MQINFNILKFNMKTKKNKEYGPGQYYGPIN
jgi:hypothetical protein